MIKEHLNLIDNIITGILAALHAYVVVYYMLYIIPVVPQDIVGTISIAGIVIGGVVKYTLNKKFIRHLLIKKYKTYVAYMFGISIIGSTMIFVSYIVFYIFSNIIFVIINLITLQIWQERVLTIWKGEELVQRNYRKYIAGSIGGLLGSSIIILFPVTYTIYVLGLFIGSIIDIGIDVVVIRYMDKYISDNNLTMCINEESDT